MTKKGHQNIMQQRRRGKDKGPYRHFLLFSLPAPTMPMSAPQPAKITALHRHRRSQGWCRGL